MNLKSKIIDLLREGEKTIRELSKELRVSESVVRKELSDLMKMGVVASRKVLNERHRYIGIYRLAEEVTSLSEEEKRIFRRVEPALAGRTSIIVVCPKCGEEGRLRKGTERGKTVFYIIHGGGLSSASTGSALPIRATKSCSEFTGRSGPDPTLLLN